MNYIVLAIPAFFVLIGVELLAGWLQRKDYYRLDDSIGALGCGVLQQLVDAFTKAAILAGYVFFYERARILDIPERSALAWAACYLAQDFLYYWYHRLSHETNLLWASHVVHHQSEEFNLSVALRQAALPFAWLFYLPLSVIGFPPLMIATVSALNSLYQFWVHTRAIGKLGAFETLFNTPSAHRVHHARNPKYIDRNYAGTLIVWDRLFGTYKEEEEEPVYGITAPLQSWDPVWANLSHWSQLLATARRSTRWADRLRLLLARPGWRPEELGGFQPAPPVDRASYVRFETPVSRPRALYLLLQFLLVLVGSVLLLFAQNRLSLAWLAAGTLLSVWGLVSFAALFERRRWAIAGEAVRVGALLAIAAFALIG
jgi:sterol desaturase/sphingolipid hydroxylase (fatty acid hydroxylase superfamily)